MIPFFHQKHNIHLNRIYSKINNRFGKTIWISNSSIIKGAWHFLHLIILLFESFRLFFLILCSSSILDFLKPPDNQQLMN
jgi:hypothetical protein